MSTVPTISLSVDQFEKAVNAAVSKPVRFDELCYPVEVRDDGELPIEVFSSAPEVVAFIRGYAWGTSSYPEVPPLRIKEVDNASGKEIVVELTFPLVIRESTRIDTEARAKRVQARRVARMVQR